MKNRSDIYDTGMRMSYVVIGSNRENRRGCGAYVHSIHNALQQRDNGQGRNRQSRAKESWITAHHIVFFLFSCLRDAQWRSKRIAFRSERNQRHSTAFPSWDHCLNTFFVACRNKNVLICTKSVIYSRKPNRSFTNGKHTSFLVKNLKKVYLQERN